MVIRQLEAQLEVYGRDGQRRDLELSLSRLVEQELTSRSGLRLDRDAPAESGAGRLRVTARLSPDAAAGVLHAMIHARLDRTDTLALDWELDRQRPLPEGELTEAIYEQQLDAAVTEVLAALEAQGEVVRLDQAGLIAALSEDDPPGQQAAARALGDRSEPAAVAPLCDALEQVERQQVAESIAAALGAIGDDDALSCLSSWAGRDPDRLPPAIDAVTEISGSRANRWLEEISADEALPQHIRDRARAGGRRVRGEDTRDALTGDRHQGQGHEEEQEREDALITALRHEESAVRIGAAHTLATQRRSDAVEPLCGLLDHEDPETAAAALSALAEIGDEAAIPCLLRWSGEDDRRIALVIEALVMIGGSPSRQALELFRHDHRNSAIRQLASEGLERLEQTDRRRHAH